MGAGRGAGEGVACSNSRAGTWRLMQPQVSGVVVVCESGIQGPFQSLQTLWLRLSLLSPGTPPSSHRKLSVHPPECGTRVLLSLGLCTYWPVSWARPPNITSFS